MTVQAIPAGCNTVNAYLVVKDAEASIDFYTKAFGGEGGACLRAPDGSVMHAEIRIGNSTIMLSQENPAWELKSAETLGGSPVSLHLYVEDADALFKQAIDAGCTEVAPLMDAFWGDRFGKVCDPFGLQWSIATHVEDVSPAERDRRAQAWFASM
ncbi:MAG: VOC family protein [Planctomycetota bacterium]